MIKKLLLVLICLPVLLLSSCSKSNPQPTCEEGGVEVKK